jgi:hypothetical protein
MVEAIGSGCHLIFISSQKSTISCLLKSLPKATRPTKKVNVSQRTLLRRKRSLSLSYQIIAVRTTNLMDGAFLTLRLIGQAIVVGD